MKKLASLLASLAICSAAFAEAIPQTSKLWPDGKMPGPICSEAELVEKPADRHIKFVSAPALELYKAKGSKVSGLVIVCPGGGYNLLAYDKEGVEIAKWLAKEGVSAVVLKYRVPGKDGALMDLQRAIRVARANADKWNIDPNKIAVLGFSAGANLCARASTLFDENSYQSIDETDKLSARPDFTALIYPAYCDEKGAALRWQNKKKEDFKDYSTEYELAKELKVSKDTPPAFIAQSLDDKAYINAAIAYFLALKQVNVPVNLHVFDKGGHGYGMRNNKILAKEWIELCKDWLEINRFSNDD